ncbi:MAG: TonB-dependent receptor [Kiritimatiellae bacterium]|nr:TonB-dependent receptor [Kiritimatiellia bacterium]
MKPNRTWICLALAAGLLAAGAWGQEAPSRVFSLGEVQVVGTEDPAGDGALVQVSGEQADGQFRRNVAEAAALAPGVTLSRVGARGETVALVRGFDSRQVPLFIDGIPVYVPYDGNIDMSRLDVFDMAGLSISKGYSPVIYGPNTLGGAINVVSRRPVQPEELEARAGVNSGNGMEGAVRAGMRRAYGYAQAGVSWRERDYFRVADNFRAVPTEDGGRRDNSDSRDVQISAKLGWTPKGGGDEEIAGGFVRQDSQKGVPAYAGTDPEVVPRYWRYTEWLKNSVYVVGRQSIGQTGYVKPRLYYDTYENTLKAYDDATLSTQTRRSSFTSIYDDYAFGGSVEAGTTLGERQALRAAVHYKQDVHREHNRGDPRQTFKDETWALGVEDRIALAERWSVALGASVEARRSLEARDANSGEDFSSNDNGALNPQAGLFYAPSGGVVRATVARKTRFPTLKDRYSYRLGKMLPNPGLDPESAWHGELGYEGRLADAVRGRVSVFYSRLDDTIQSVNRVAQDEEGAWLDQPRNVGESENTGLEAGLEWRPSESLMAGVEYAYLHRRNLDRPEIKLTGVPEHALRLYGEWAVVPSLTLLPSVEGVSSRYYASDGKTVDGFWLAHLEARVDWANGWAVQAGIHNLFDENYALEEGYPEEGRSLHASVQYRF